MPKLSAGMNIMCSCCYHNNNDDFCGFNGKEDNLYESGKDCDVFKFCKWHLIDFLRELKKVTEEYK